MPRAWAGWGLCEFDQADLQMMHGTGCKFGKQLGPKGHGSEGAEMGKMRVHELAKEYGLAARVWLEPSRLKARQHGFPVVDHPFLDSFSLDVDGKSARYAELLHNLPTGLSEWAMHPALGNEESRAIDGGWRVRRTDYEFLISPEAREILQEEKIIVMDYRTIQQAWLQASRSSTSRGCARGGR